MANISFPFPYPELAQLWPEIWVAFMAMALLLMDVFLDRSRKQITAYAAIAVCLLAAVASICVRPEGRELAFYGFFVLDPLAHYAKLLLYAATAIAMLLSLRYMREQENVGEYYVLILFSMLGMMLLISATNMIMMYLGLELMALCIYVLVGYHRRELRSSEAALKYFILGSLASGMLLYGMSFIYGVTGLLDFMAIGQQLSVENPEAHTALMLGMVFVLAGMAFKISAAPFHMWTPDAYEGAPTPITAFMSVAPKVAAFVVLMRLLHDALPSLIHEYTPVLMALAIITMIVGNLAAIAQRNIKRMMAYSTVGHVGFVLLGLLAANAQGYAGIMVYMTVYLFMTMGAFAVIILMRRDGIQGELIDDFAGLSKVRPAYALAMGLFLFSLAGIPFLGGFWAKYAVFVAAIGAGYVKLTLFALLMSAVGAFYYLRLVKYMYFDTERVAFNFVEDRPLQAVVLVSTLAVVLLGLFPSTMMEACQAALTTF